MKMEKQEGVLSSGNETLDALVGGFKAGELVILAGHPCSGKNELAYSMLRNLAVRRHVPTAFFSFYTSPQYIAQQLWDSLAYQGEDAQRCLDEAPLFIVNEAMDIENMFEEMGRLVQEEHVQVVFVDSLQYMLDFPELEEQNEQGTWSYRYGPEQYGYAAKRLRLVAQRLNVVVVLLSSLHCFSYDREGNEGKMPVLGDLANYYGDVPDAAHIVIGTFRPENERILFDERGRDLHGIVICSVLSNYRGPVGDYRRFRFGGNCLELIDEGN